MNASTLPAPGHFRNPLAPVGADPWLVWHDGFYYLTATGTAHDLQMRRARSLTELAGAEDVIVWRDDDSTRNQQIWAPEFYLLDGPNGRRWYLYYTASDGTDINHRLFVLEGEGDTPLGPYTFKAQLQTDPDNRFYGIDAGVLQTATGELYCLWAGHPGHVLFIQRMSNPWTLQGARTQIPASGFGCDDIREGPVCLRRDGKIFLVYSMCDTGHPYYRLGMLVADESDDLLNASSWKQHPQPVLERYDAHEVYGPGHNGFFHSPDGTETWIIYHAKDVSHYTYERRTPRAHKLTWRDDGTPDFGTPPALWHDVPLPSGDPNAL